jgi:hypothetical protein
LPASPAPFSVVFEFTERRGSFVYVVWESPLMRSTIEVEDFDFQGLRDTCAHPAPRSTRIGFNTSREAAPGSRQPMGPRARAARPQSTGAGALRGPGAPSRTTRRRAARPPGGPSRFQAEETPEYVTVHGHGRAQPARVGAGAQLADFGLSSRNSRSWHSIAKSASFDNSAPLREIH